MGIGCELGELGCAGLNALSAGCFRICSSGLHPPLAVDGFGHGLGNAAVVVLVDLPVVVNRSLNLDVKVTSLGIGQQAGRLAFPPARFLR